MYKRREILIIFASIFVIAGLLLLIIISIPESKEQTRTDHFTFIFSSDIEAAKVNYLAGGLEGNYARIGNDLKTIPANSIEVNIYSQRWRYIKATGNWGASGSIEGVSKLHFVEQAWGESDAKKVALHEFTHAVVLKMLIDKDPQPLDSKAFDEKFASFPMWLWEAVSVYEAGQFVDPKTLPFLNNNSYPNLSELNGLSNGGKIYSIGYTIVEYILFQYGQDKLIELIKNHGDLPKVLYVTPEEFSKNWYGFVKEKYLK